MSLQTVARSCYIIFLVILWTQNSLAYILDGKKCISYEEVPEAPKIEVEHIQNITFNSSLKDRTRVKYGQHIKLICDIQFSSPMSLISWRGRYRNYTKGLSEDHKEFDIKSVNIDFHGQYITCEATLASNPKIKKVYGTSIVISDLASPLISLTNTTTVMENDNIKLTCKIVRGTPGPRITWQMKSVGENEYKDLLATGEDLTIENTSFKNAGQYKCIAKNVRGQATKTTEVFVQKAPVVIIEEIPKKTYSYGDTAEFTCKIEGYPLPNATWSFRNLANKHNIQDTAINWHERRSQIKLHKLKKSHEYSCIAVNKIGTAMSSVNVTVLSPFVVHQHPEATTDVHYGTKNSIVCNITSAFPMRIKWFHRINSSQIIQIQAVHKNAFQISSDETRLTINSVDFDTVGNYTCEASLVDDENETTAFTTDVQVDDLAPPLLSDTAKMIVTETNWVTLYCKITGGVPRPTLSWFVKRHGEVEFSKLPALSEELDIENITISKAGHYRCIAENHIGQKFQNTEVLVRKAPITDIEEGSTIAVPYGSNNTFSCNVVAYPLPTITWEASSYEPSSSTKDEIKHEHLTSSKFTVEGIKADNTYSCHARNPLGEDTSRIQVTVLSPFVVHEHPADKTFVHYAASKSLICNITTSFPMRIKWFYNDTEIHSSADYTISSDETKLDIKSTNLDLIGNYTCEAYLVNDVHVNEVFTTDLQIDDLEPPVITSITGEGATITVKNLEELSLTCKAKGNPEPVISWQSSTTASVGYQAAGQGETLCSTNAGHNQAGIYKCTASNIVGIAEKTINVNVV